MAGARQNLFKWNRHTDSKAVRENSGQKILKFVLKVQSTLVIATGDF